MKSSAIEAIGHDGDALIITFTGGREYRYPTAGAEHVDALAGHESPGRYFNTEIKPHHDHAVERRGAAASFIRTANSDSANS